MTFSILYTCIHIPVLHLSLFLKSAEVKPFVFSQIVKSFTNLNLRSALHWCWRTLHSAHISLMIIYNQFRLLVSKKSSGMFGRLSRCISIVIIIVIISAAYVSG